MPLTVKITLREPFNRGQVLPARRVWGSCLLCFMLGWLLVLPGLGRAQELQRFEYSQPHMGTRFRMVFYAEGPTVAQQAARQAFDTIASLNRIMSDYLPDSELNRLSQTGGTRTWVSLSPALWDILHKGQALAKETDGAFDITVGPVVQLWRQARRYRKLPEPTHLAIARQAVGHDLLKFKKRKRQVRLKAQNMRLDLGGIAKGYAVDCAMEVLKSHGISAALIDGGGDLLCSDPPPGRSSWRVSVKDEEGDDLTLELRQAAVATSGDLYQFIEVAGVRYSHIVNPRTGLGLTDQSQVTVIAPRGWLADALASAISVMGPEGGMELVQQYEGVYVRLFRNEAQEVVQYESPGFDAFLN